MRPLPEGDRYLGFLFARAGDPAEAVEAPCAHAHARLRSCIDRTRRERTSARDVSR